MKYNAQHIANIKSLFENLLDKEPSLPSQLVVKLRKLPEKAIVRSNIPVLANLKEPLFFRFLSFAVLVLVLASTSASTAVIWCLSIK